MKSRLQNDVGGEGREIQEKRHKIVKEGWEEAVQTSWLIRRETAEAIQQQESPSVCLSVRPQTFLALGNEKVRGTGGAAVGSI